MKPFKPSIAEDLNRPYDVTLTEGQIATILYILEGAVDNFYSKVEAAQSKQPTPEWED